MTATSTVRCPYCGQPARWVSNEEIYGARYGASYMAYLCKPCDAYVGCHQNTRQPQGTLANAALRAKRIAVHAVLDPLYESRRLSRNELYRRLAHLAGRPVHVGEADLEGCEQILRWVTQIAADLQQKET